MTIESWLVYVALVLAATSTPGPAVLFIMTNATTHGWRKSIFAALGNIVGLFCLGLMSVAGLGAVLKTSEFFFNMIKYAGAAYLVFLGLKLMFQKKIDLAQTTGHMNAKQASARQIFFQAWGVAISNPKAIIFLTALFPQFVNVNAVLLPQFSMLIATLMIFSFLFLTLYALLAHHVKVWLARPNWVNAVNRTSGSIFIAFGFLLAASFRK